VETVDPAGERGTGWAFRSFSADAFIDAMGWALLTYSRYPDAWKAIQRRGMTRDFSWDRAAGGYEAIYAASLP
jgi:starch synthase